MWPKFSFYDQFGYILTGFYQVFALWILCSLISWPLAREAINLAKPDYAIPFVLITYFAGHLLQAIANLFDEKERKNKEKQQIKNPELIKKARSFFKLPNGTSENKVWQYCYMYSLSNDCSGQVQLFNSMYSLYRGIWVASLVAILASGLISAWCVIQFLADIYLKHIQNFNFTDWNFIAYTTIYVGFAHLFYNRKERFLNYLSEKVFITFDILSKDLIKK